MTDIKLGCVARDTITGIEGTVVAFSAELFGAVMRKIQPTGIRDTGSSIVTEWFNNGRLEYVSDGCADMVPKATIKAVGFYL